MQSVCNGTEFVRTATANSYSSQAAIVNIQPSQTAINPLKWILVKILNNQWMVLKSPLANQWVVPSLATGCLDLKFR